MDKNKIKSYAVWARRAMIEAVKDRAFKVGIEENKIHNIERLQGGFKVAGREEIFNIPSTHRDTLVKLINEKGYEQVIEEVAYTWFNRFMGLRFMEVNDYLPTGVRILSSEDEGKSEPDVLTKINDIEDELNLNIDYVYELQDKGTEQAREELYKYILIKQCNELGKIIPQMFEKIQDYTELLFPDNLLQECSVIRKMVTDIDEEDWKEEVEIIGWMYQYYISEKKDEVFAALKKNVKITKENIPAATQLFTPKWIVKYMVENSLGRLWLEGHPNEELQKEWKYYLEEAEQEPEVEEELKKIREEHSHLTPEDIKVLDPCMGSGHILVYAFDVLYQIYKEVGYGEREIPKLILQNNLYGLDIDDRAAQLASFALIMKARHYNRRLFREIEREDLELNLCSIQESNEITDEAIDYFANGNGELKNDIKYLVDVFTDAKEYGSILEVKAVDFEGIKQRLREVEYEDNLMYGDYRKIIVDNLPELIKQGEIMSRLYEVCVTNPPYMGNKGINLKLKGYIDKQYKDVKSDLFAIYMKRNYKYTISNGNIAYMTPFVWMFINSYENLRKFIVEKSSISSLIQLEYSAFEEATVPICTFVLRNNCFIKNGIYLKLSDFKGGMKQQEKKVLEAINCKQCEYKFNVSSNQFDNIPGYPISYWISNKLLELYKKPLINTKFIAKEGVGTRNDNIFMKLFWEVSDFSIGKNKKWLLTDKAGGYKKWYMGMSYVMDWENDGYRIKNYRNADGSLRSRPQNLQYMYKKGISWGKIGSGTASFRFRPEGFAFNDAAPTLFGDNEYPLLGFLNSKICKIILEIRGATLNLTCGVVEELPLLGYDFSNEDTIIDLVDQNIMLSIDDWDSFETSWDFKIHPLLKSLDKGQQYKLSSVFNIWENECEQNFTQLKSNEEELNRIFIDIYGLQDELTPEVEDKDVTIRKADRTRDIKSLISYAVGCMFGRYSIDTEGLIYAGGEFSDKWNIYSKECKVRSIEKDDDGNVISDSWVEASFVPDKYNIIPITEDEYFEDDIVSRFIEFIRTVYGGENLEENLDYIADSIGRKTSETSRQTIRRYFLKEFYKDHLKVYQKRPIYWMFDSGKNDGFKALVYVHRYNESTVAKLRTDYLHSLQRKYEAEILRLQTVSESTTLSAREKTQARKKIDRINKQIEECKLYDQVVAHVANERISIDLDDGVKHNYGLFQGIKVPTDSGKEVKMDLLTKI